MVEHLFKLLDQIVSKESSLENVVQALGAEMNSGFLQDEIEQVERLIVLAFGGNEGHFKHISSTDLFYKYNAYEEDEHKKELVDYIKLTISEDFTDEIEIRFIRG
jgi:hypothetical protein